ncbi:hypothetical protein B0H14DRAFT_2589654 [Mycena olivaceomarginata]|nr:hypothetical protein B0H14DRAFT_2589654 [Mycena olivaceomarginata]
MDSRGIRAQALTLTKSHEERIGPLTGIAQSAKLYGFDDPLVVFSDDPIKSNSFKDKNLVYSAFPGLAKNLAPPPSASGLESLDIPANFRIQFLSDSVLVDKILSSFTEQLDNDENIHLCISLDAEWNISRTVGVSILQLAPHSEDTIFIIPVHRFKNLPTSLLRLLVSDRVFKIGSRIKGDLTRLQKQFAVLRDQSSFNVIDLKEYSIQRGVIGRKDAGGLDSLVEKVLTKHLPKFPSIRRSDEWEGQILHSSFQHYAALDVFASRMVFERVTQIAPLDRVKHDTTSGTRVALLVQEGGEVAAYGKISDIKSSSFQGVRVVVPSNTRVIIEIDDLLLPSVAATLHLLPHAADSGSRRTMSGAYTLGQLKELSSDSTFSLVSPVHLLEFDRRDPLEPSNSVSNQRQTRVEPDSQPIPSEYTSNPGHLPSDSGVLHPSHNNPPESDSESDRESGEEHEHAQDMQINMLEANAAVVQGKRRQEDPDKPQNLLPPHGLRAQFFRAFRDHLMRWDPEIRKKVDGVCRDHFGINFDVMLSRQPDWIKQHTLRYVPPPRIIVPAMEHVFNAYGHALDAESGLPLFSKKTWQKANAVLELGRQAYLSDVQDVQMYRKSGVDRVEGGPHSDIYRKFGALHGVHKTRLQCWEYHHSLSLINRISFLLNYLSGIVNGAEYSEWLNADLYETTTEKFGICPIPESLRLRLQMEPFNEQAAARFKMKGSNDWFRRRQGVALPILPPSTPEARQYFFRMIPSFATAAADNAKHSIDYSAFAQEWNKTADGKTRYYITTEVLMAYAKSWKQNNNSPAGTIDYSARDNFGFVGPTCTLKSGKHLQYMRMIPGASANSLARRNFSGIEILSITTSTAQHPKSVRRILIALANDTLLRADGFFESSIGSNSISSMKYLLPQVPILMRIESKLTSILWGDPRRCPDTAHRQGKAPVYLARIMTDDTENFVRHFLMECHKTSSEAQFIEDSLPNAETPTVERVAHQLDVIQEILCRSSRSSYFIRGTESRFCA